MPFTAITVLWFTGGSAKGPLLQCSCQMQLCLEFAQGKPQAMLTMFLPATPAETPSRSSNLPLPEGVAVGRGMTPPGEEHLSCTMEGKRERSLCHLLEPGESTYHSLQLLKKIKKNSNYEFHQKPTITDQYFKERLRYLKYLGLQLL